MQPPQQQKRVTPSRQRTVMQEARQASLMLSSSTDIHVPRASCFAHASGTARCDSVCGTEFHSFRSVHSEVLALSCICAEVQKVGAHKD